MFKTLKDWVTKYFSDILGIISLLTTIFFGYFFVPTAYTEYKEYKKNFAEQQIINSTKEIIFSDTSTTYKEVKRLIDSKQSSLKSEINKGTSYYLRNAANSFMEDKFLSLNKRRELIDEINGIIDQATNEDDNQVTIVQSNAKVWITSILGTTLLIFLGLYSYVRTRKNKKDKEEELKNELKQVKTESRPNKEGWKIFQDKIISVLENLNLKFEIQLKRLRDSSHNDIQFNYKNNYFVIQTKYLQKSKVGLKTIQSLIDRTGFFDGAAILIYNTELTALSEKKIKEFNKKNPEFKIYAVKYINEKLLREQLQNIVNKTA